MTRKVGIAGLGAIGKAVAQALENGIQGLSLHRVCDLQETQNFSCPYTDFEGLARNCDLIIEALPPAAVPDLTKTVFAQGKDLIIVSSSALLIYPEILTQKSNKNGRVIIPPGALCGIDGVTSLAQKEIKHAKIATTKPPHGYAGAPYITQQEIALDDIKSRTLLFSGNAYEAAKAFPANVNVAATLSLAGLGAKKTQVEIWADPNINGNCHEIEVSGAFSTIKASVENKPDPQNPKTSALAAQSVIAALRKLHEPLVIL